MMPPKVKLNSLLLNCVSCPRRCQVNRYECVGFCKVGADVQVSHIGLHYGEEPPISGTKGSGAIFFSGCNLRCVFCQNFQISQLCNFHNRGLSVDELADEFVRIQDTGAHNVNLVSPSHVIPQLSMAIAKAKEEGLCIPVVYNSSGYDSITGLQLLRGLVDIYLPDIKYMNKNLAFRYSGVHDYADIIPGVLWEMFEQVGLLRTDEQGIALSGILVRHLVLPGQLENSKKCLYLLASISKEIMVSIMSQYSPCHRAGEFPEIDRPLYETEYREIVDYAIELGLENAFIQDISSQDIYQPDFDRPQPFVL